MIGDVQDLPITEINKRDHHDMKVRPDRPRRNSVLNWRMTTMRVMQYLALPTHKEKLRILYHGL